MHKSILILAGFSITLGWYAIVAVEAFLFYRAFDGNIFGPIGLAASGIMAFTWSRLAYSNFKAHSIILPPANLLISSTLISCFEWVAIPTHARAFQYIYLMQYRGITAEQAGSISDALMLNGLPWLAVITGALSVIGFALRSLIAEHAPPAGRREARRP